MLEKKVNLSRVFALHRQGLLMKIYNTIDAADQYILACRSFLDNWMLIYKLLAEYPNPNADKGALEMQFLKTKSTLARDLTRLKDRLQADFLIGNETIDVLMSSTNLHSVHSQSDVAVKKLMNTWHRAYISINETLGMLDEKRRRVLAGERVPMGDGIFKLKKPFPTRKVLKAAGAVAGVFVIVVGLYFMRNFLGFWAPRAGAGIAFSAEQTDEEKIRLLLDTMKSAVESEDIDKIMTAFSDDYIDEEKRGKTEVRALLKSFQVAGGLKNARMNVSDAEIEIDDDTAVVSPTHFTNGKDEATLAIHGARQGDTWLITSMTGL